MSSTIELDPPREAPQQPPQRPTLNWLTSRIAYAPALLLIPIVILPVLLLVYGTFRSTPPGQDGAWTLDNYRAAFSTGFGELVYNSFLIGVGSASVAFVLGLVLALAVTRYDVPGARSLDSIIVMPAYMPAFLGAIAWLFLLSPSIGALTKVLAFLGLPPFPIYSMTGIIFVSGLYGAPVAYLYLRPALLAIDSALEEAARVSGASPARTLIRVVLPLIKPALFGALIILFITGFGEFSVPAILGTDADINVVATQVLVLTTISSPAQPGAAAVLGLFLALVTVALLLITNRMTREQSFVTVSGRMSSTATHRSKIVRGALLAFCILYIVVGLVLPVAVLVLGSLQPYLSPTLEAGWTLKNFVDVLTYPNAATSITNSIVLSVLAAIVSVALSMSIGFLVVRRDGPFSRAVDYVASSPLAIPNVVFGLALIWVWVGVALPVYGTKWILLLAFVGMFLPFVVRASVSAFRQVDIALEEAGRVSGASPSRVTWRIVLPLLVPAMMSGATIVMYHSMREVAASLLLYSPGNQVMPVAIWDLFGNGVFGQLFALAVINIAVIFLMVALGNLAIRKYRRV